MSIKVQPQDLRSLGYCAKGWKRWCEQYGLDFRLLLDEGLDAEAVEATGDEFGIRAAQHARERSAP